ncbi:MAG TPA: TolC family protein [Lentimicrobium sp.]|nr:TolC family protein [Lentimicrobium sp.]
MNLLRKRLLFFGIFCFFISPLIVRAQDSVLTIEKCQELARNNYPMIKTLELIQTTGRYNISNIKSGYLPSISFFGQYTTQSDVTKIPISIPNMTIPEIDKNQYKVYAEISQLLYDGGHTAAQKKIMEAQNEIEEDNLEIELYKVKERVTQVYFGIILTDAQIEQVTILKSDILAALKKSEAAFNNGIILKSNLDALKAELLKTDQKIIELESSRKSYLTMLELLVGTKMPLKVKLSTPLSVEIKNENKRPENHLFFSRLALNKSISRNLNTKNLPKLNLFINGGYGSPALNMLNPDPDTYFVAGLRFVWPLTGLYNLQREKAINKLNLTNIQYQQEAFLLNSDIQMTQQNNEIEKYEALLKSDDEIIALREDISKSALLQLENGIITSSEYIRELNAVDNARQSKILHEIQLIMSKYNHLLITGNL